MVKPKVYIIHDKSLDGYIASHILHRYNIHYVELLDIEYIPWSDNLILPERDYNDSIVYILGLDFSTELIKDLNSLPASINIFSNFESDIKKELPDLNINISTKTCTSMLVWGFYYAYSDTTPKVITLLSNYTPFLTPTEESIYLYTYINNSDNWDTKEFIEELFVNTDKLNEYINKGKLLCINKISEES